MKPSSFLQGLTGADGLGIEATPNASAGMTACWKSSWEVVQTRPTREVRLEPSALRGASVTHIHQPASRWEPRGLFFLRVGTRGVSVKCRLDSANLGVFFPIYRGESGCAKTD